MSILTGFDNNGEQNRCHPPKADDWVLELKWWNCTIFYDILFSSIYYSCFAEKINKEKDDEISR